MILAQHLRLLACQLCSLAKLGHLDEQCSETSPSQNAATPFGKLPWPAYLPRQRQMGGTYRRPVQFEITRQTQASIDAWLSNLTARNRQYLFPPGCGGQTLSATELWTTVTIPIAPLYLLTTDYTMIVAFFTLQGFFGGGGMHTQWPHYLSERFPTEVRATATGFCYHQGAIFGGLVGPVLSYFATEWHMGFAIPMMIGTTVAAASVFASMLFSPETRGTKMVSDIQLA